MMSMRRPSPTDRTHDENWHGSYYELAIKLGSADDARLETALIALWEAAQLGEPFRRDGNIADVSVADLLAGHLNGVANIPGLGATLASVVLVREEYYETGLRERLARLVPTSGCPRQPRRASGCISLR